VRRREPKRSSGARNGKAYVRFRPLLEERPHDALEHAGQFVADHVLGEEDVGYHIVRRGEHVRPPRP
jgi:hypothetical protein